MTETIDALLERLCREHDLDNLDIQFRRDGGNPYFGSTAIWGNNADNCWGTGATVSLALSNALANAKTKRGRNVVPVPAKIAAPEVRVVA